MNKIHKLFTAFDELPNKFMQTRRKHIFISYAREDIDAARKLYKVLCRLNKLVDIWFDEINLLPGHNWKQEITKAISRSDLFIAIMSDNSVNKRGIVQNELRQAIEVMESIPPDNIYLIPVRLDDCQPQHLSLSDIHRVDLFPDWNTGVNQLVKGILSQVYGDKAKDFSRIDLCQVTNRAVTLVKSHEPNIHLTQHIDRCEVFGNENEINQVILNFILNAFDFRKEETPVEVDVYKVGLTAFIKVTNTGKYILKEDIYSGRIFEPYFTTLPKHPGLGLAVSNAIIHKHSGSIYVESVINPSNRSDIEMKDQAITSFTMSINLAS